METEPMMRDDISDFGKDVPKKNKQYWKDYFNKIKYRTGSLDPAIDPIHQINSINFPGKYQIFYMIEKKHTKNEIIIDLMSKHIEVEEL